MDFHADGAWNLPYARGDGQEFSEGAAGSAQKKMWLCTGKMHSHKSATKLPTKDKERATCSPTPRFWPHLKKWSLSKKENEPSHYYSIS
jgi:hypothetical protein